MPVAKKLTDCDVLVAATLATISLAPRERPDGENLPYVERALESFEGLLFEIAKRGGTVEMRRKALEDAQSMND